MSEIDIDELRKNFGRRLRIGFIGGGRDSVIGGTHLAAMRVDGFFELYAGVFSCLLYTSPSPRDGLLSRMPSSA